jgi:glycosyltransferase involved in cell wall biosynthesis
VVAVQNGIDTQKFTPDRRHARTWRARWGLPPDALVFGALGRFAEVKGYDTALVGFQELLRRFPEKDLRLVLAGEGYHEKALRARADQVVPADRVTFAPFCDRPWEALCALDVFLMPSLNEGLPLTLLEAMACGCCPVATTAGGIPEVLCNRDLGWLVPMGDAAAFTNAMAEAASLSPEQRAALGVRAREQVVKNFNAPIQFNRLVDVIESVAPGLAGPRRTTSPVGVGCTA